MPPTDKTFFAAGVNLDKRHLAKQHSTQQKYLQYIGEEF
jgi:hypothetical protein